MSRVLEGVRVVEVSAWAFVPSAGAVLADWGADVVKIEPPTGDPIRGLVNAGVGPAEGLVFPWEIWNRGKRSVALDLTRPRAQEIVLRLVEEADVFLTSYLAPTREKLGLDAETVRGRNPSIIYACGTGQGPRGPEADKGGYDSISFWSRGSVSAAVTPPGHPRPVGMPAGAFGDSLSGMSLAGGIAAALVRKARTGEGAMVDGSLLGTAMWCMQMGVVGGAVAAASGRQAPAAPSTVMNPLVNTYRTSDDRWVALCMLQPDVYFEGLCRAIARTDMVDDPRFSTPEARAGHTADIVAELEGTFAAFPLDHWRKVLAAQKGQWDVVNRPLDLLEDEQAKVNGFVQMVDYGSGRQLPIIASPVQIDRTPPRLRPAPDFGADTDNVLQAIGMDMDAVIEAKIDGAVI
ncbi:MAG TPA: CoA transferase [Acidimicrobiales bacterium]|nr:CoA transferase [Acidimicrobiales bacterium]